MLRDGIGEKENPQTNYVVDIFLILFRKSEFETCP